MGSLILIWFVICVCINNSTNESVLIHWVHLLMEWTGPWLEDFSSICHTYTILFSMRKQTVVMLTLVYFLLIVHSSAYVCSNCCDVSSIAYCYGQCGLPAITTITPAFGPTVGGNTITIRYYWHYLWINGLIFQIYFPKTHFLVYCNTNTHLSFIHDICSLRLYRYCGLFLFFC